MARFTREELLINAYQKVFLGSAEGQLVFWDIVNNHGMMFRPFGQQNAGAYALEGKRELALHLMHMVNFTPENGKPGPAEMDRIMASFEAASKLMATAKTDKED